MKLKIPKPIRIGYYVYKYLWLDDRFNEDDHGVTNIKKKCIALKKEETLEEFRKTVIHEDIHAVLYEGGIRDLDGHFEHCIIECVTEYIYRYYNRKQW